MGIKKCIYAWYTFFRALESEQSAVRNAFNVKRQHNMLSHSLFNYFLFLVFFFTLSFPLSLEHQSSPCSTLTKLKNIENNISIAAYKLGPMAKIVRVGREPLLEYKGSL